MIPLYAAGRQLTKVRAVMLMSLACAGLGVWWGIDLAQTHGLNTGDGVMGAVVAGLGLAFAAGMWTYGRCYAARIDFDSERRQVHLHTVRFWRSTRHVIDVSDIRSRRWHDGQRRSRISVDAPWLSVRLAGWRLPLIIDAQGVVLDKGLMKTYFGTAR